MDLSEIIQLVDTTKKTIQEHRAAIDKLYGQLVTNLNLEMYSDSESSLFHLIYNTENEEDYERDKKYWLKEMENYNNKV